VLPACRRTHRITEQELTRRTKELVNAVAVGDRAPWNRYFADDCNLIRKKL